MIRYDDTIDAASTTALFAQIKAAYPKAATITVFCDNARCLFAAIMESFP